MEVEERPKCKCHGLPMYRGGMKGGRVRWRCRVKRSENRRRQYWKDPERERELKRREYWKDPERARAMRGFYYHRAKKRAWENMTTITGVREFVWSGGKVIEVTRRKQGRGDPETHRGG